MIISQRIERVLIWIMMAMGVTLLGLSIGHAAFGQIVLNEALYDDQTVDTEEFVELYNAGPSDVDLTGWSVVIEGDGGLPIVLTPPSGSIIASHGYFTWVSVGMAGDVVMPPGNPITGTGWLPNGGTVCVLRDSFGTVHDSFSWELWKLPASSPLWALVEGPVGFWGTAFSGHVGQSIARYVDGLDSGDNGWDVGARPATPGSSNDSLSVNARSWWTGEESSPGMSPGFRSPFSAISAWGVGVPSPHGGSVLGFSSGGSTTDRLANTLACWVWVDYSVACPDWFSWSIGVAGTGDVYHVPPQGLYPCVHVPTGHHNAETGIAWQMDSDTGTVRLVDEMSGGNTEVVLATASPAAGWNLCILHLDVTGNVYAQIGDEAFFITGRPFRIGAAYIGYRQNTGTAFSHLFVDSLVIL